MTMRAKTNIEAIKSAMDDMTEREQEQFVSFVEGMAYKASLTGNESAQAESA